MSAEDRVVSLTRAFEEGTLPIAEWTHAAHLSVALGYVRSLGAPRALERMRGALKEYNAKHMPTRVGYHETITRAWIAVIDDFIAREDRGQPLSELAERLVTAVGDKDFLLRFYARDRLFSDEARAGWVAPDVAPLPAPPLRVRLATADDLPAINAIYNHYVLHSTCTFQTVPSTIEERAAWFAAHGEKHPITVALDGEEIVGWASLSVWNPRQAYARTVENSVYVHPDRQRRGVGRVLLADLIERAKGLEHHTIIAVITEEQAASIGVHRAFGFVERSTLHELGWKFERWIHVTYMQRML